MYYLILTISYKVFFLENRDLNKLRKLLKVTSLISGRIHNKSQGLITTNDIITCHLKELFDDI